MEDRVKQLRRALRSKSKARARNTERGTQLLADETAIMRELVQLGVTQADVGRDAGITRMAVGLRLNGTATANKARRRR